MDENNVSKVLGVQKIDFKTDAGDVIKGNKLFIAYSEDGIEGMKAEGLFLKDGFELPEIMPGDNISILYNRKGRPIKVMKATSSQPVTKASTPVSPAPARTTMPAEKSIKR
ncbi:MAG: hypothetical protein LBR74_02930 [Eubacterium sp.]|jgi:hypothetical protein|nr:hypothetical protein [Eubacterium sp.]